MKWTGFAVARPVSDEELRQAVSSIFGVDSSLIPVVELPEDLLQFPDEQIGAAVVRWPLKGDFRLRVGVFPRDNRPEEAEMETMRKLARALRAALLVSDDSPNPSTRLRVWPDGRVEPVVIDVDALDDRDEVIIVNGKRAPGAGSAASD